MHCPFPNICGQYSDLFFVQQEPTTKAFHLIFYFPKHFFSHMRKIACKICIQFILCKHFLTQQTYGVQKCVPFSTPNARCQDLSAFFDTKHVVSKNVYISRHWTLGVYPYIELLTKTWQYRLKLLKKAQKSGKNMGFLEIFLQIC